MLRRLAAGVCRAVLYGWGGRHQVVGRLELLLVWECGILVWEFWVLREGPSKTVLPSPVVWALGDSVAVVGACALLARQWQCAVRVPCYPLQCFGFSNERHAYSALYLVCLKQLNAWATANFHVANVSPPNTPELLFTKIYIPSLLP